MEVGDSWVFKGFSSRHSTDTYREEIVGTGEGHFLLSHEAERTVVDKVYAIDQRESYPRVILIEALEFPLHVGKRFLIIAICSFDIIEWVFNTRVCKRILVFAPQNATKISGVKK